MLKSACLPVGVSASRPSGRQSGDLCVWICTLPSILIHTHIGNHCHIRLSVSVSALKIHVLLSLVSQGSFQPFSVYTNPSSDSNNPAPVILICINPVSVGVFVQSAQFPGHSFSLPSLPPPSLESLAGATRVGAPALPAPEPGTIFSMQGGAGGEDGKGRTAFVFLVTFLFAESAVCQLECAG